MELSGRFGRCSCCRGVPFSTSEPSRQTHHSRLFPRISPRTSATLRTTAVTTETSLLRTVTTSLATLTKSSDAWLEMTAPGGAANAACDARIAVSADARNTRTAVLQERQTHLGGSSCSPLDVSETPSTGLPPGGAFPLVAEPEPPFRAARRTAGVYRPLNTVMRTLPGD